MGQRFWDSVSPPEKGKVEAAVWPPRCHSSSADIPWLQVIISASPASFSASHLNLFEDAELRGRVKKKKKKDKDTNFLLSKTLSLQQFLAYLSLSLIKSPSR